MKILLTHLTVVNAHQKPFKADILIEDDRIIRVGNSLTDKADRVIDMEGLYAFPGFIDLHAHLRDPGKTDAEDIASGTMAAVCGGITAVIAMPNTNPVCDNETVWADINERIKENAQCDVFQAVAGAKGLAGHALSDFDSIKGLRVVSDDGKSEDDSGVVLDIFRKVQAIDAVYLSHAEDDGLRNKGVITAGAKADQLGLPPIYNAVEDVRTYRDCALAAIAGSHLHMCHVSTAESLRIIAEFKKQGLNVTCEVTPHHFTLSDDDIPSDDAMYKMNPPLRSKTDRQALVDGIRNGIVDAIATDHAPHLMTEKAKGFRDAPFGILGFESMVPLTFDVLFRHNDIELGTLSALLSANPAKILGLEKRGEICEGYDACLSIIDLDRKWTLTENSLHSKTKNTPFIGRTMTGKARYTVVYGKLFDCDKEQWL